MLSQIEVKSLAERVEFSSLSGKRILVTGGSGMLGGYVIASIIQVLQMLGLPPAKIVTICKSGEFQKLDIFRNNHSLQFLKGSVEKQMWQESFEIIIHAASPASPKLYGNFDELFLANVRPVEQLISRGNCSESFIFISSGTLNGVEVEFEELDQSVACSEFMSDLEKYSYAKFLAEKAVSMYSRSEGINGASIRLYPTFGPGIRENTSRATTDFLWKVARREVPLIKSDGNSLRTFLYLEDACAAIIKSIISPIGYRIFDLSGENVISISDFARLVSDIGGMSGMINIENSSKVQPQLNNFTLPNLKIVGEMGMLPKVTMEEGISRTIEWIRKQI